MRILSARARQIMFDRGERRVHATIILTVEQFDGATGEVRVRTSAPVTGRAPLKDRLIASAKLIHAMQTDEAQWADDADSARPAA